MSDTTAITFELVAARSRLDKLRSIQFSGVTRVSQGDKSVQHQTGAELAAATRLAEQEVRRLEELLGQRPARRSIRQVVFIASKGL